MKQDQDLAQELKELLADLKRFRQLWPYEQQYVLRRTDEILKAANENTTQVLTLKKWAISV